jgi:hypothetical protein
MLPPTLQPVGAFANKGRMSEHLTKGLKYSIK